MTSSRWFSTLHSPASSRRLFLRLATIAVGRRVSRARHRIYSVRRVVVSQTRAKIYREEGALRRGVLIGRRATGYIAWLLIILACVGIESEAQSSPPRFDAVSVKRAQLPAPYSWRFSPGHFVAKTVTLTSLISKAYGIPIWRIVDRPKWLGEERFDIQGVMAEQSTSTDAMAMLRTLLEERFRLKAQVETREVEADFLIVSEQGAARAPGLRRVDVDCETTSLKAGSGDGLFPKNERPPCDSVLVTGSSRGASTYLYSAATIESLANDLSGLQSRPIIDKTGLFGLFDIRLEYAAKDSLANAPFSASGIGARNGLSLEQALEEQLGLKLKRTRANVEYMAIRSVERPLPD